MLLSFTDILLKNLKDVERQTSSTVFSITTLLNIGRTIRDSHLTSAILPPDHVPIVLAVDVSIPPNFCCETDIVIY